MPVRMLLLSCHSFSQALSPGNATCKEAKRFPRRGEDLLPTHKSALLGKVGKHRASPAAVRLHSSPLMMPTAAVCGAWVHTCAAGSCGKAVGLSTASSSASLGVLERFIKGKGNTYVIYCVYAHCILYSCGCPAQGQKFDPFYLLIPSS